MFETWNSPAPEKPSPRPFTVIGLMLIVQAIWNVQSGLAAHETWRVAFYGVIFPIAGWIWVLTTLKCLRGLRLSRLWMLPASLPIVSFGVFLFEGWRNISLGALALAFIVQLAIAAKKPYQEQEPSEDATPDGPST
jgi:hypothetical protein